MQGSQISILSIEKTARQQLFVKPQQINKVYKQRQHKMPKSFVLACTQVLAWPKAIHEEPRGRPEKSDKEREGITPRTDRSQLLNTHIKSIFSGLTNFNQPPKLRQRTSTNLGPG